MVRFFESIFMVLLFISNFCKHFTANLSFNSNFCKHFTVNYIMQSIPFPFHLGAARQQRVPLQILFKNLPFYFILILQHKMTDSIHSIYPPLEAACTSWPIPFRFHSIPFHSILPDESNI